MSSDNARIIAQFMYSYNRKRYDEIKVPSPLHIVMQKSSAAACSDLTDRDQKRLKKLNELRAVLWEGQNECTVKQLIHNAIVMLDKDEAVRFIAEVVAYAEHAAKERSAVYGKFINGECFMSYLDNEEYQAKDPLQEDLLELDDIPEGTPASETNSKIISINESDTEKEMEPEEHRECSGY